MGCVRKRGNRYQAQVRRAGCQPVSKTFVYRQDAEKWVREIESRIDRGQHHTIQSATITLGELLRRYRADIMSSRRGRDSETRRLNRLLNDSIALTPLSDLSGAVLSRFRDRRVKDGKRATQYDLVLIRHAIEVGRKEWGIALPVNPVSLIRILNGTRRREQKMGREPEASALNTESSALT